MCCIVDIPASASTANEFLVVQEQAVITVAWHEELNKETALPERKLKGRDDEGSDNEMPKWSNRWRVAKHKWSFGFYNCVSYLIE